MALHNVLCYSQNYSMKEPKKEYIKEWNEEKEKVELLQELIEEEKEKQKKDIIAVRSGFYFKLFHKCDIPYKLKKTDIKLAYEDNIYQLYQGTNVGDILEIDKIFGDESGLLINDYKITKEEEEEYE